MTTPTPTPEVLSGTVEGTADHLHLTESPWPLILVVGCAVAVGLLVWWIKRKPAPKQDETE